MTRWIRCEGRLPATEGGAIIKVVNGRKLYTWRDGKPERVCGKEAKFIEGRSLFAERAVCDACANPFSSGLQYITPHDLETRGRP